jgi:hypothetical protein
LYEGMIVLWVVWSVCSFVNAGTLFPVFVGVALPSVV